jgi:predicted transcriptional regulator
MTIAHRIPSGELQTEVLRALQKLGKASAKEVLGEIGTRKAVAYTTVNTVLDRLHRSGLVNRSKAPGPGGMKYLYSPASGSNLRSNMIRESLRGLVSAFGPSVVSAIYEGLEDISKEELGNGEKTPSKRKSKQ